MAKRNLLIGALMFFFLLSAVLLSFFSFAATGYACSCVERSSVQDEHSRSGAVFSGKVLGVTENKQLDGRMTRNVLFEVSETWKGVHQMQVIISTGLGGGDCGIDFKSGESYLVYAVKSSMYGSQEQWVSTICDRTAPLSAAQEDIEQLGTGNSPSEPVNLQAKFRGSELFLWALVSIGMGMAGFWFWKKKQ